MGGPEYRKEEARMGGREKERDCNSLGFQEADIKIG